MNNNKIFEKVKMKIAISNVKEEDMALKKSKLNIGKGIGIAACIALSMTGVTFADEISKKVFDIYNFRETYKIETKLSESVVKDSEKLEEALSNKNSIIPWSEKAADTVEGNNLQVNISRLDMDDYYMSFEGSINFPEEVTEKMPLKDIYLVRFPDLVIRDENDNILFCMEETKIEEIFGTDDLEAIKKNPKYCISEVSHYSFKDYNELGNNPYNFEYSLSTSIPSIYPKAKKLTFEFTKIALDSSDASIGIDNKHYLHQDQSLTVLGNWKIDVDVPKQYSEREDIIPYKLIQATNSNSKNRLYYCYYKDGIMHALVDLESIDIPSGPWGTVKIEDMLTELEVEPIIKQYIIYKICSTDEYKQKKAKSDKVYEVDDYYIENSNGKKSKLPGLYKIENGEIISASNTRLLGGAISNGVFKSGLIPGFDEKGNWGAPNGNILFDIDKEDLTDEMTIHIEYLGKDIEFKVEKMKGDK